VHFASYPFGYINRPYVSMRTKKDKEAE